LFAGGPASGPAERTRTGTSDGVHRFRNSSPAATSQGRIPGPISRRRLLPRERDRDRPPHPKGEPLSARSGRTARSLRSKPRRMAHSHCHTIATNSIHHHIFRPVNQCFSKLQKPCFNRTTATNNPRSVPSVPRHAALECNRQNVCPLPSCEASLHHVPVQIAHFDGEKAKPMSLFSHR
jgi:hypothetical protein